MVCRAAWLALRHDPVGRGFARARGALPPLHVARRCAVVDVAQPQALILFLSFPDRARQGLLVHLRAAADVPLPGAFIQLLPRVALLVDTAIGLALSLALFASGFRGARIGRTRMVLALPVIAHLFEVVLQRSIGR